MEKFQVASTIESISTRSDNTIKVVVGTQELNPEQATILFGLKGKLGYFLFAENGLTEQDVPDEPAKEFKSDKTPSQRLRAALYVYWEKNTNHKKQFDEFYKEWMEKKISEIKEYLPE